ncbi:hypothetical protein D3C86_1728950 [compost metagenome]
MPCFAANSSLYCFLILKISDISTSLKVVNIAVSFFTETNLAAIFLLRTESFVVDVPLFPPLALPIAGTEAVTASSFVILPSLPEPLT